MTDRAELFEAALEVYPEGIALLDAEERVVMWNRAAESLTGYGAADVVGRAIPETLEGLTQGVPGAQAGSGARGVLIRARHKCGHDLALLGRTTVLRDSLGRRIGMAALLQNGEHGTSLPHGETSEDADTQENVAGMEERLELAWREFESEGTPLGVLWMAVDQAQELRKTHGRRACETMLASVERTLANGLRPGEEIGRWGDDEFLVVAREADEERLEAHGHLLAGLARTAEFRWWGDRASLTVSVGVAAAMTGETLAGLLERAREAMHDSMHAGGNHAKLAARRAACSRS